MYDELVKRLRLEKEDLSRNKDLITLLSDAADAIEELRDCAKVLEKLADKWCEAVPKWIPVSERLPECEGARVLVASKFLTSYLRVSICYFSKNLEDVDKYDFHGEKRSGFYANDSEYGYYERPCVRYWMPLPEPPKEE